LFVLLLVSSQLGFSAQKEKDPVATLTIYFGDVQYIRKGIEKWNFVKRGMFFYDGDRIKTYADGKAELFFSEGSVLRIANESEMEFSKPEGKKERRVFMNVGKVFNKVVKGTNLEIESIHGVASVKGTEFDVHVGEEMDVWVADGLVEVSNATGKVLAEKNTKTTIKKDKKPEKKKITPDMLPKRDDMKAKLKLKVSAPGKKIEDKVFKLKISVKDMKTNKLYKKKKVNVKIVAMNDKLKLSKDGSAWGGSVSAEVVAGKLSVMCKGKPGTTGVAVTGKDMTGRQLPIKIKATIKEKSIYINFLGEDDKEHKLRLKFKRK
jgi:hypothetical protein